MPGAGVGWVPGRCVGWVPGAGVRCAVGPVAGASVGRAVGPVAGAWVGCVAGALRGPRIEGNPLGSQRGLDFVSAARVRLDAQFAASVRVEHEDCWLSQVAGVDAAPALGPLVPGDWGSGLEATLKEAVERIKALRP